MKETGTPRKKRGKLVKWLLGGLFLCAIAVGVAHQKGLFRAGDGESSEPTFDVIEGPLTISVTESGTIKPQDQIIMKSEVQGSNTILYLIEEGTRVEEGDLLVELDASDQEDAKVDQQIRVQNAEAAFIQSQENLEVVKNQAKSDMDQAELTLRFAGEDLKKYKEGEYPNQLKEMEALITIAEEGLKRAEDRLKWSQILYEEKYLSEFELKADELSFKQGELDLNLAENNLKLLEDYTNKRTLDQLESDLKQADMAMERVQRKASADVIQAEADLRAKESEFKRQKDKLSKLEEQIEKAKIVAPTAGVAIYASSAQKGHWHGSEPLAEGQDVRERQELIYLPTASTFIADIKVHESSLQKISLGLRAKITVDAVPDMSFTGDVSFIAPLPDPQSMFMNPDLKEYNTEVRIEGGGDVLRTGMTCKAEMIVERFPSTLYVPVQAVVRVKGESTCYVRSEDEWVPTTVEVGLDNNRMIQILNGINVGDRVLLTPPLDEAGTVEEVLEEDGEGKGNEETEKMKKSAGKPKNGEGRRQP